MRPQKEEQISTRYVLVLAMILGSFFWIQELRVSSEVGKKQVQRVDPTEQNPQTSSAQVGEYPLSVQSGMVPQHAL